MYYIKYTTSLIISLNNLKLYSTYSHSDCNKNSIVLQHHNVSLQ